MTVAWRPADDIARARLEVAACRALLREGFPAQAVSRAYYAAFAAATGALGSLGESRSKHSAVIAAFGRLIIRDRGFEPTIGKALPELFTQRNVADYGQSEIGMTEAEQSVDRAEAFVDAVEHWLAEHDD